MTSPENSNDYYYTGTRTDVFPLIPKEGGTLLDFGGGIGQTGAKLKQLGYVDRAGVVDLVAEDINRLDLDFVSSGDFEDAAFVESVGQQEGPFQIILCLDILEHLRDPWAIISQLHDSLTDNGCIIASIPNVRNYKALFPLLFKNQWALTDSGILDRTHFRFFVRSTAIDLMTSSGLVLEDVRSAPNGGLKIKLFRMATFGLFDSFTDRQYLIRVRRVPIQQD